MNNHIRGATTSNPISYEEILDAVAKMEEIRVFEKKREEESIRNAVLICNRENKFKINQAIPDLCVYGTDICDDNIYMVIDKELAENIRRAVRG